MSNHVLFSAVTSIGATLLISIVLIKKKHYVRALTLFILLYILGQIIGYGFNVDLLKAVIPSFSDPENGVAYQVITSTLFPLLIAFTTDYLYKLFKEVTV